MLHSLYRYAESVYENSNFFNFGTRKEDNGFTVGSREKNSFLLRSHNAAILCDLLTKISILYCAWVA